VNESKESAGRVKAVPAPRTRWQRSLVLLSFALLLSQAHAAAVVYEYDDLGRLKSATFDGATRVVYQLDHAGNRTQVTTLTGGALRLSASSNPVSEGGGSVTISVQRVGSTLGAASVTIATANGTAVAGSDYVAKSSTLSWASGNGATKTFSVTITQDALNEGSQTFQVALSNATGGWIGSPGSTIVTILDDDAPSAGTLQFTSSAASVGEGAGTVAVNVSRTGGTNGAVSVVCSTADGTAIAGADYPATTVTLNWTNGDAANKSCVVPILNDPIVESSETFTVALGSASGAALGATTSATVTIADNDLPIPGIPGNLRTSPAGVSFGGNYTVLWDTATGSPTYYVLEETRESSGFVTNYTINAPTVSKNFSKGNIEDNFYYRCKACNVNNECSIFSNPVLMAVCMTGGCQ
jgi:hypothetical protein